MASGGARVGAGRKVSWFAGPATSTVSVPPSIRQEIARIARRVDELLHAGFTVDEILSYLNHIKKI